MFPARQPRQLREPFAYASKTGFRLFFSCHLGVSLCAHSVVDGLFRSMIQSATLSGAVSPPSITPRRGKNVGLVEAFGNSLMIALVSTVVSIVLGTLLAILLWRFRFRGKALVEALSALPIVMPEICVGIALLVFFQSDRLADDLPWPLNLSKIILAHITFTFPFVMLVIRARLVGFNPELEQAARDLGASQRQALFHILIPYLRPGLVAGGLLALTLSLDDFVITFFTAGPDSVTFPIKIYSLLRRGITPDINAASTVLILLTLLLAGGGVWWQARMQKAPLRPAQEGV